MYKIHAGRMAMAIVLLMASVASTHAQPAAKPRLAVLVIIDQFRHENLKKFGDLFVEDGFRRLMDGGAWMTDARYSHLHASTSPGHNVITSGMYAYKTGIIANSWYDRSWRKRRRSLVDPDSHLFGKDPSPDGRASTKELQGTTLADELRMATNFRGKAITISAKDYSAMISAGKIGTPYWYEASLGRFTSSSFFMDDLPPWVKQFNARKLPDKSFGRTWERLLPEAEYVKRVGIDDRVGEEDNRKSGTTFPHVTTGGLDAPGAAYYNALKHTPWSNDLELEFARQAIIEEQLGQDDVPDLLIISLSANDYVGHDYGPLSQEVMDMTLRTDRQLADFFGFLDQQVGRDKTLLILTADHGALPIPEQTAMKGIPAARVPEGPLTERVEQALDAAYGDDDWVEFIDKVGLYLNYEAIERHQLTRAEVEQLSAEALEAAPSILKAFTRTHIERGQLPDTNLARAAYHSFHPDKSGDVMPIATPYYMILDDEYSITTYGTTHGMPHDYDIHVPLLFYGPWIKPGYYRLPVDMADVTPTICELLGITMPATRDGQVLGNIIGD
jgi:predicted AlkP superfamily pyrophosphatase or phosphodiesterase